MFPSMYVGTQKFQGVVQILFHPGHTQGGCIVSVSREAAICHATEATVIDIKVPVEMCFPFMAEKFLQVTAY